MFAIFRVLARAVFLIASFPFRLLNFVVGAIFLNIRWRWVAYSLNGVLLFTVAALVLAYPVAFAIGWVDPGNFEPVFRYADQRARGTALFDASDRFIGIIDPHLDSVYDLNLSDEPVVTPSYIAYPDHKSLHVSAAPEAFWSCLKYHEDRYLGTWRNPFGIDVVGLFRMPYSSARRSIKERKPRFGAGGSTLSMQLARTFLKQLPSARETMLDKVKRKIREWWLAPIMHHMLQYEGGDREFARWAANHLPIAQRVGGQGIFGVELASRVIFDKPAATLSRAQQYVLAAAVNRPIEVLPHKDAKRERVRLANWQRLVTKRAGVCADASITGAGERAEVKAELARLSQAVPQPKIDPQVVRALENQPHRLTGRSVNPVRRANNLLGVLQYGVRQELVERHGYDWRNKVAAVQLTFDALANQGFVRRIDSTLSGLLASRAYRSKNPQLSFDIRKATDPGAIVPRIVIAAANGRGEIVRYYENHSTAVYFGSKAAWDGETGRYDPAAETLQLASLGKILAAVALGNEGRDRANTPYRDRCISPAGAESCRRSCAKPHAQVRFRPARVVFACSLGRPLTARLTRISDLKLFSLVRALGMSTRNLGDTPIETAIANGLVAASPRTVHQLQRAVLERLAPNGTETITPPTMVRRLDLQRPAASGKARAALPVIDAATVEATAARFFRDVMTEPICHPGGTLRGLRGKWCSRTRKSIALHVAKTGTRSFKLARGLPDTMDLWISGQIHFTSGRKYTYVVYVGTGDPRKLMGRFSAGAQAGPLLRVLLEDLAGDAARS
ncbi:MAG: transglycosylase domain-containing protein [Hyphomicrobiales bacterium]